MRAASSHDWTFIYPHKNNTWVDSLADLLFQWLDAPLVRQTAGEVARECHIAVWNHVYPKTHDVSHDQVRGYVRAVAPGFIVREVDTVLHRRRVSGTLRPRVVAEATEQLIELIASDLLCAQPRQGLSIQTRAA